MVIVIDVDAPQRNGDQASKCNKVASQEPQTNALDLMITLPKAPAGYQKRVSKERK